MIILSVFVLSAASCGKLPAVDYLSYRAGAFKMDGRLECSGREYTLAIAYEKDGALTATVTSPVRIAGCVVTIGADGNVSLTFGGVTVGLTSDITQTLQLGALAALRDLLLPSPGGLISAKVTKLGGQIYNLANFAGNRGDVAVWFDRAGVPVRFEADGAVFSVTNFSKEVINN